MATSETINVNSHNTALCLIPPRHLWPSIDRLRVLYDKAFEKWPPHVNLVYPFVAPDTLPRAAEIMEDALRHSGGASDAALRVCLDTVSVFPHKHDNTIFVHDGNREQTARLSHLRRDILKALGQRDNGYRMHMTVAQSEDIASSTHKFLEHKVGLLPAFEWEVEELHILIREQVQGGNKPASQMKLWATLNLTTGLLTRLDRPTEFYTGSELTRYPATPVEDGSAPEKDELPSRDSYYFDDEMLLWLPYRELVPERGGMSQHLAVSSYNVLGEFDWPASQARYPLLVKNILSRDAASDVLALQEVTDDFLSYLLRDEQIRDRYPFTSHGPPEQSGIEPLPNLVNIVVLSKRSFSWALLPLSRKHKGAVVARFGDLTRTAEDGRCLSTIVTAVHLNHGLTDGAVAAKKADIQTILGYLSRTYADHAWILAGDFNISTSSFSIGVAAKKGTLSAQSASYLEGFERMFEEAKLVDTWKVSRFELGDASDTEQVAAEELVEGERGATYDPLANELAASIVGSGSNMRPQRYDRILVRGGGVLSVAKFNKFGFLKGKIGNEPEPSYASDHWGVRCVMRTEPHEPERTSDEIAKLVIPVHLCAAPRALSDPTSVEDCLAELDVLPSGEEIQHRQSAFDLLKHVLQDSDSQSVSYHKSRSPLLIVPVGSYGLGVWTSASDMDVLCIGPFSSTTFFALAVQRIRNAAAAHDIRLIRRVKANSGTMLELDVRGIKTDLQYCPATSVSEKWPHVLCSPPTDPVWTLPAQSLSKLKAVRDLDYLRRSIPDPAAFRVAHRFVKTWARARGIYAARFGYLGGMQISILLARVHKLLSAAAQKEQRGEVSVPDILSTFFHHYAGFDWRKDLVFDPFFHRQRLNYTRTSREPLAVLGYFPPALNAGGAASVPSVRTLADEFGRAARLLGSGGMASWRELVGGDGARTGGGSSDLFPSGAHEFLGTYKSYVKVDVQYWGLSLGKGAQFLGWLESRFVHVLVDIERRLAGVLHARMWPARFVEGGSVAGNEEGDEAEGKDYQGCYLVGLGKLDDVQLGKDEMRDPLGALQSVLRRVEEQIRGDGKYFDAKSCWISATVVSGAEIKELGLEVDGREWGEYTPGDEEVGEEEEEDEPDLLESDAGEEEAPRRKKGKSGVDTIVVPKLEPGKKFRTAADVMNRLRWDPEMDSGDFIVGYEDRFVGAREKALDTWKSEQTDEEFIPQHRILYFKRKSDGVVVWERRTRKDEVFGSGV